jgi:xanthine dehydrogenase D subunit
MLWGQTVRSPHASARIRRIDVSQALAIPGVAAVITADDVPGSPTFGLERSDQPVFARDVVRYYGEPVAAIAAIHPEVARRAAAAIEVDYEPLVPLLDAELATTAAPVHPDGNVLRHLLIRRGDQDATGDVVVEGTYRVGMQDQAFMGPESGIAFPTDDGGVELHVATQWLHNDRAQVAACLGLPEGLVRLVLAGVGGAFGAREDVSLHIHLCLLALRVGHPVKMVYQRDESFLGHVHRHPAVMRYRHHAARDGRLVKVEAHLLLDGGAYTSSSPAVIGNAACFAAGPYRVPNATVDAWAVRTNNPPCGAMRGFGAVQSCFAYESQMDRLARALSIAPVELRLRNALAQGDRIITGQRISGTAPVAEVIRATMELPMPEERPDADGEALALDFTIPGGAGLTAEPRDVRRGVGFAVGIKGLLYGEGYDDNAWASVRLELDDAGEPMVTVSSAASEVGQGFVTLAEQIAETELGVRRVVLATPETSGMGSAGSSSASRQSWMSGGAIQLACREVLAMLVARVAAIHGREPHDFEVRDGEIVARDGGVRLGLAEALADAPVEASSVYRPWPTKALDDDGQGDAHASFVFAAHRAVVDVDPELGLVRVLQIATAQDVGRALNPLQVLGQIEGGVAQGVGLAVMEELVVEGGVIRNPSFTDYLIPTAIDMPEIVATLVEQPEPGAPFGAKGVGEPPTVSSTPAVVAAIRAAIGKDLTRVPVRPQDVVGAP